MVLTAFFEQTHAVDVTDWPRHEEFSIFPVGSKPKEMLICPGAPSEGFLIPEHPYLFKIGAGRFEQQAWSEVIAYRLGSLLGLPVPPCFIAIDRRTGQTGALIEFFYGHAGENTRFVHASDFMTRVLTDKKRGRPHHLLLNLIVSRVFSGKLEAKQWWAKALAFDTLIGNTDRHPDNWGFLFRSSEDGRAKVVLAPLFDNGTSLGYEIAEAKLAGATHPERVKAYISRGTHHSGWHKDGPLGHFDLCREFAQAMPGTATLMKEAVDYRTEDVASLLNGCVRYETSIRFSEERAALVFSLIEARRAALTSLLEG